MQHARGFIVGCANGWLWSPGRQSTPNSKLGQLYMQHVTYGLQGDWLQHYLYHISTQVIRGTQMFVLTCSWKKHSYFATPMASPLSCWCSSRKHHTVSFARYRPSLFCKFHPGRNWGGISLAFFRLNDWTELKLQADGFLRTTGPDQIQCFSVLKSTSPKKDN